VTLQPFHDWVHPTYEYWGQSDPTQVMQLKISNEEMVARVKSIFVGRIRNRTCPKVLSVYCPTKAVSDLCLESTLIFVASFPWVI
jgi:hypothetical protein